jgi:hypothetical protein
MFHIATHSLTQYSRTQQSATRHTPVAPPNYSLGNHGRLSHGIDHDHQLYWVDQEDCVVAIDWFHASLAWGRQHHWIWSCGRWICTSVGTKMFVEGGGRNGEGEDWCGQRSIFETHPMLLSFFAFKGEEIDKAKMLKKSRNKIISQTPIWNHISNFKSIVLLK